MRVDWVFVVCWVLLLAFGAAWWFGVIRAVELFEGWAA